MDSPDGMEIEKLLRFLDTWKCGKSFVVETLQHFRDSFMSQIIFPSSLASHKRDIPLKHIMMQKDVME